MDPCLIPVKLSSSSFRDSGTESYDILIQSAEGPSGHSLIQLGSQMRARGLSGKALVVSHPGIAKHFAERLLQGLHQAGFAAHLYLLPAGERYKTLRSIAKIYDAALAFGLERSSTLVALGGGVIGDMVGFAAATWLRGIPFVQVPTSLLAMVDAAIGGKTGVNHPQGKNLIGAFYQPRLVWIDPTVLKTLPPREFTSALAEVIKYGVIQAADVFEFLEDRPQLSRYADFAPDDLHYLLRRSAECKAWVVQQDEKEAGLRAILNYGHTLGHALETATHYRRYLHGEAVAIGMVAAGEIARRLGWWSAAEAERQRHLIEKAGLPSQWPAGIPWETVLRVMQADKKVKQGRIRFVLPRRIGQAELTDQVELVDIQAAVESIASPRAS
ncbi:MAG TPA: 3-dehydroquinate synthase [Synechococcus sp. M44_DOE_062]|nr:3-dehydroquinate synthase [Synechococcus sp. M44_DOE_062]